MNERPTAGNKRVLFTSFTKDVLTPKSRIALKNANKKISYKLVSCIKKRSNFVRINFIFSENIWLNYCIKIHSILFFEYSIITNVEIILCLTYGLKWNIYTEISRWRILLANKCFLTIVCPSLLFIDGGRHGRDCMVVGFTH